MKNDSGPTDARDLPHKLLLLLKLHKLLDLLNFLDYITIDSLNMVYLFAMNRRHRISPTLKLPARIGRQLPDNEVFVAATVTMNQPLLDLMIEGMWRNDMDQSKTA